MFHTWDAWNKKAYNVANYISYRNLFQLIS